MSTNEMRPELTTFRLSPQQEQLCAADGRMSGGVVQAAFELPRTLAGEDVRDAVRRIVERHEILRTTLVRQPGMRTPGQLVHDDLKPSWQAETWAPAGPPDRHLDDLLAEDAARPVDAESGPTLRARLLTPEGDAPQILLLSVSRACADVASLSLVAAELATLLAGPDAELSSDPLQYADYAEWRRELLSEDDAGAADARAYAAAHALEPTPPVLFADPPAASGILRRVLVPLAPQVPSEGARAFRTTPAVFLEACWHACLARVTGETDVVAGAIADGRAHEELRDAVGPYAQLLPMRTQAGRSFAELVDEVARARAQVERGQDYVEAPLLEASADALRVGFGAGTQRDLGDVRVVRALGNPARLLLELRLTGDALELHYDTGAVPHEDAVQLAAHVAAIAESAAADAEVAVADLQLTPLADRPRSAAAVRPLPPAPVAGVHELFERQAAAVPDALAVVAADGALTYRELDERSSRLARHLRALGVEADVPVGLCMDRSAAMIEALVAVLKAGGAYVPLNYEHPAARLAHQLAETGAAAVITQEALLDRLPDFGGAVVCVDRDRAAIDAQPLLASVPIGGADDRVYVMYTSGSTGLPKGVEVTHRNLASYVSALLERLGLTGTESDRLSFATVSAISTDLGNTSVFGALLSGGTLHLVPHETAMDGALFASYAAEHPLDVLKITPSQLRALVGSTDPAAVLPRRWLVLGGEALRWEDVDPLLAVGKCRILNHYGPTETTVGACTFEVAAGEARRGATVPIGHALANARVDVVDERLRPVPPGVPGEILIGGRGVAHGYVAQPEQTAAVFVPDPFGEPGERAYRTGDRARVHRDGAVEFLGRRDDQVKIRGYRVEPAEVEEALRRHPSIRAVAVAARAVDGGEPSLVGYVVSSAAPGDDELKAFLREHVPAYLVPARFVTLDTLPLTASGKVDRAALPDPGESPRRQEYVAPRTALESSLVEIWEELLGVRPVGVHDDFFGLGGHSLLATQVVIRIRRAHADIPLHAIFDSPTVAGLAAVVEDAQAASAEAVGG